MLLLAAVVAAHSAASSPSRTAPAASVTDGGILNCGTTTKNCHPLQVGVNEDWAISHYQSSELNVANQDGLRWIRFPWSWRDTQPDGPGDWRWGLTDRIMASAQAAGEKVIFKPQGSPCWAHPSVPCTDSSTVPPDPQYLSRWQDYIRAVLQRYPATIVAVEVWNEPNLQPFWDAPISPDRYVQVLRAAYTATKSVDPSMPVVYGGLAAVTTTSGGQMAYQSFLSATLSKGARGYFDAAAIHPYPTSTTTYLNQVSTIINNVRTIVAAKMPIWITEFGYPATSSSEALQATQITSTLNLLAHTRNVPVAIIHRMFDKEGTSQWAHFGLVRTDYSPKPSYCQTGVWTFSFASASACSISTHAVSLSESGDGSGTVTSSPSGISCDASCTVDSANYPAGTDVTLTAAPAPGSIFGGWSGDCSGTAVTCTVTADAEKNVSAEFVKQPTATYALYLNKAGGGAGSVVSSPEGISCGQDCGGQTYTFPAGTQVTLTAAPGSGSTFAGWSNACTGTSTCTVTMNDNKAVGAWFSPS